MKSRTAPDGTPVLGPYMPRFDMLGLACAVLGARRASPGSPASALIAGAASGTGAPGFRAKTSAGVIAGLVLALFVSACAGRTALTPAQVLSDTTTIITVLGTSVVRLDAQAPGLIPPATAAKLQHYIADAEALTAGLSAETAATQSAPALARAVSDLNAVLDVLATFPLPPSSGMIVQAASILLPVVETFVTVTLGTVAPAARAATPFGVAANAMTENEARAILLQAAAAR